ncbi:proton/glutamate symport protein [Lachnospiraceae bacterium KM106-2]|nr:proton/glutamate symport protein [Lachnospiraceae bacterium KM106-2]
MKKKISLTTIIFIALIAGAILGVVLNMYVPSGYIKDTIVVDGIFYVLGQGFIRLMQMLVVPLVFFSLICGILAIDDTKQIGKVGIKTLLFYMATTALAVIVALSVANVIDPGRGLDMSKVQQSEVKITETTSFTDTLLDIIPKNPFESLANGTMLQVIFFALFVGIVIAHLGEKAKLVAKLCEEGNAIMMLMTTFVMKAAPIGVFCLIARTFSSLGFDAFGPMIKYMAGVFLALAIQCLVVYMLFLKGFTGVNPFKFLKKFAPVMGFAFSTASSNATIPLSIETLSKKMGVSKKISSFTIPLGATVNMDGTSIMQGVAVVFIAQAFHINLTMMDYVTVIATATLASVGTAGVPSVGLITLSMVLSSVGLPVEGIALIMGIDRILDMTRTAVNITGDAVCTTIIAKQEGAFDREIFNKDFGELALEEIEAPEL